MISRPKCKYCGGHHWANEPHQWKNENKEPSVIPEKKIPVIITPPPVIKKKAGRKRKYSSNAERQKAYRDRKEKPERKEK